MQITPKFSCNVTRGVKKFVNFVLPNFVKRAIKPLGTTFRSQKTDFFFFSELQQLELGIRVELSFIHYDSEPVDRLL